METLEKDNFVVNTIEPNNKENNDKDEMIISYFFGSCLLVLFIFISIIGIFFPVNFILLLIRQPYISILKIDKKKKTLTRGNKGVIHCSSCCFFNQRVYDLDEIKNVKIKVISQQDPLKGFGKIHLIECYIYSNNDESEILFSNIKYTKEKYDEFVTFFKKYIPTIEEPLDFEKNKNNDYIIPNEIDIKTGEQNNIESKPSINESAAMPIIS
jgi:hypothetical protein